MRSSPSRIYVTRPAFLLLAALMLLVAGKAQAVPLYARQTGQECAACHNGFPELTPYGRLFKLNGYTFGGGQSNLPPVSAMAVVSFTHTSAGQPGGAAPHYGANDNFSFDVASIFYGGAITQNIGMFGQVTYDNVGRHFGWDNTDIRFAHATDLMGKELIFGATINNNPTVTDVWNSTPAWGYPWLLSELAPFPGGTLIEGGLAQQVVGATAYGFWNRLVYAEFGFYGTLAPKADVALGADPTVSSIKGAAPYWRLALEPRWGRSTLEIGTFGLAASLNPGRATGFGTDHTVDIGFDTQYQFLADRNSFSVQASFITENDSFEASQALGAATFAHDQLRSFHVKTSYYWDQTYGGTLGYFRIDGSGDPALFSGLPSVTNSPNSAGFIGEADYFPFNHGGPSFWPWLNMKVGLEYIHFTKFNGSSSNFDGAGRSASDNDTLFLFGWLAF